MKQVSNPCSWHVRLRIPMFCHEQCVHWQREVDVRTAGEVAALDNPPRPDSEE